MEPLIVRYLTRAQARSTVALRRSITIEDPTGETRANDQPMLLGVRFGRKSKDTGRRMNLGGFGMARISEDAGPDRGRLDLYIQGDHTSVSATRDGVYAKIRRIR